MNVNALLTSVLSANSVTVADFTGATHAIPMGAPLYLRSWNPVGVVMHNTSGLIALENMAGDWATKSPPPPSHLAIAQSGTVAYFVKLNYADRATENTNKHISIEFQAVENGDITGDQITSAAIIYGFLHDVYGVEFSIARSAAEKGLAHHSLFVDASNPQAHANCPGSAIVARKQEIIDRAKTFAASIDLGNEPTGRWGVRVSGWYWIYQFSAEGGVTWRDPYNGMTGSGTWKSAGSKLSLAWKGSKTIETWDLPLSATAQTGQCQMEGEPLYALSAMRITT
jgi:hypothetical protein